MLEFIAKSITKVFGTKSDRDIKNVLPQVEAIKEAYARLQNISDDELRAKTSEVSRIIDDHLKDIDGQISLLKEKAESEEDVPVHEREAAFDQIDRLEEERNKELEVVLNQVLPEAFAIVKETARRLKEIGQLVVTATQHDREYAAKHEHVDIDGDQAIWHNEWLAAGNKIKWDMLHYDVQLIGGIVLHDGKIAEMATGEGKTLVATLPTFLNALSKRGVHIVTVNDYLARRDSEWMAPLFEFHGLSVDCIDKYRPNSEERRKAYQADITYGTNNEFGFDYLRDNMSRDVKELVQRKHHYAMVDEVDSVLIDDARTPLIISGPVPQGDEHEFKELKPRVERLVASQKQLVSNYLIEAKKLIKEGNEKDGGLALFRAFRALPKYKPLIKYLSEMGVKQILQKTESYYMADNNKLMPEADAPLFFTIEEKNNSVELTDNGIELITKDGEDPNFFIMPDIGVDTDRIDKDENLSDEEKIKEKDKVIKEYTEKAERIHAISQLLKAYALFEKDTEYILVDGKIKIVDEQTGRVMEGRRYSDGLHQAIEAKENVKIEDATQTYATVTLQNYFRMYHKLAGMTGTAETEAGEFWEIYKLDVVTIPTNKEIVRDDRQDKVYKTVREKFNAVAEEIVEMREQGRPILVGTTSVEISELISRMLTMRKIKHQVLNAKQHAKEADVVAEAGKPGTVTIATNMAGRGTDIKLTPESKAAGGLAIVGTERHESRRVDRQLRGRSGRQGDPGSSQFFVSLEDNLMRMFGSDRIAKLMDRMGLKEGEVIQHSMITKSIERAQRKVEENNFGVRKRLLEYDDVMNSQREVIYERRRNALYGDRLQLDIINILQDTCENIVLTTKNDENFESMRLTVLSVLGFDFDIPEEEFKKSSEAELTHKLNEQALKFYNEKNLTMAKSAMPIMKGIHQSRGATVKEILVPFTDRKRQLGIVTNLEKNIRTDCRELVKSLEKFATLAIIDEHWKEHLRDMDDLKQSVQGAVYEQKDPLLIYKFESFELFKSFVNRLNESIISFLLKAEIPVEDPNEVQAAQQRKREQNYKESKEESRSALSGGQAVGRPPVQKSAPVKSEKIAGRNDRVSVQYSDGSVKKDVKFKTVEEDIKNSKCVLIEN